VAALGMLTEWGLKPAQLKLISVLGSRQGVDHVHEEFPEVEVGGSKGRGLFTSQSPRNGPPGHVKEKRSR
jgi:hypothetical protein